MSEHHIATCPRCGNACNVGAHSAAHCPRCFTSFRADAPAACLTAREREAMAQAVLFNAPQTMRGANHDGRDGVMSDNRLVTRCTICGPEMPGERDECPDDAAHRAFVADIMRPYETDLQHPDAAIMDVPPRLWRTVNR